MNIEEIKLLRSGDEVVRGDEAIGFVLNNVDDRIEVVWVDIHGKRSVETLEAVKFLPMARNTPRSVKRR